MSWIGKTTPNRIDELANELKYVREYISQLPSNVGTLGADTSGIGRRSATSNKIGPVKGIWSFNPVEVRRYHEEPVLSFMGETSPPIFLNALELRGASQIVNPQTDEDPIPIRQLVTATNAGQILFLTVKNGKTLRILKPGSNDKDGVLVIKDIATDFVLDEVVTGLSSGATCKVDFIQSSGEPSTLPAGEKKLWFRELTGSFQSNEDISGDIAGSAKAKNPQTFDTSGNINLGENVDISQNVELLLKFNPNAPIPTSPEGSWIIIGGDITTVAGGGGGTTFPILFPVDDKGDVNGTSTIPVDLAIATAHTTRMKLIEDVSNPGVPITQLIDFINPPVIGKSIVFYMTVEQDSNGGHTLDFADTIINTPSIQTAPNAITNIGFITTDGGVTFDSFVFGKTIGDNLGNHEATEDLKMNTFDITGLDVLRYADPGSLGQGGVIGFNVFGSSVEKGVNDEEFMKWSIPAREAGINRFYEWQVDLATIMRLEHESNTGFSTLDMLDGTVQNTQGITFHHILNNALSSIRPIDEELQYNQGLGTGQGGFHGFRVGNPVFPQFEIREDVVRTNVNFDLITNNIINVDQILFHDLQGFSNASDHAERRLTGGFTGINMNIPQGDVFPNEFAIWFEDFAKTRSDVIYHFQEKNLILGNGVDCNLSPFVTGATGYQLCRGGGIFDRGSRMTLEAGLSSMLPTQRQILEISMGPTVVDPDHKRVEIRSGVEGFQMFTDIDMRTFNVVNVDVLRYAVDSGVIGANVYGSAVESDGSRLKWSVPTFRGYEWQVDLEKVADLTANRFRMLSNSQSFSPSIISDGAFIIGQPHLLGTVGQIDGEQRLVDDLAGSFDVIFGTGGSLVNLSDLTAGAGTNLDIDNDLGEVGLQSIAIDWDVSNFHRMIVTGDIQVVMNNLPLSGEWQEITVEFLQDENGGNEVIFVDTFTNGTTPRISTGTNRYTVVKFYSYNDGIERILAFETIRNPEVPPFYQGIILARMSVDQQANTTSGNRLEFDTALFFDRLGVSVGGGQQKGIFSGFVTGRTYECTCHFAVENSVASSPATMSVQWNDIAQNTLIGTRGVATDVIAPEPNLHTATAYFIPTADTDTLEVRIISNSGVDTVLSGATSILPVSQVTIKDCGISEGRFNEIIDEIVDEDAPPTDPNAIPTISFSTNSTLYNMFFNQSIFANPNIIDGAIVVEFQGESAPIPTNIDPLDTQLRTGKFMAHSFGTLKTIQFDISKNTLNKDIEVSLMRDETALGIIFTIQSGATGRFKSSGNTPIQVGRKYWYKFQSTDQQQPSGQVTMTLASDITWGTA